MGKIPSRDEAYKLFRKYNKSQNLINHALAVEGVMRHIADIYGEDKELWGVVGLLHDIDYEKYPEEHCKKAEQILADEGIDEMIIHAVASHGYEICHNVKPETTMEKVLYTIDELTGLVAATALVRPSKSVMDMKLKSVKKKWKDKSFAAGVDRDLITKGADMLGLEVGKVIEYSIMGMRDVAEDIGLKGEADG